MIDPPTMLNQGRDDALRRMKRRATGLLIAMAAAYVVLRTGTDGRGSWGYLEAGAEAAMVGGIADWFAVTALFRHPLGLRIPHTAIIPQRKDQIGASLGEFVQDHFLSEEVISGRLEDFRPAERLGAWLADPHNAARIGAQSAAAIAGVSEVLSDDDVSKGLEQVVRRRLESVALAPLVGRALEIAIEGGHHQAALDTALGGLDRMLTENHDLLRRRLGEESPWWVPERIDNRVYDRIAGGIQSLIADVQRNPGHELRDHTDRAIADLSRRLQESSELAARGEALKLEFLDHPEVRAWLSSWWAHIKSGLLEAAEDPTSELRRRLESALVAAGHNLAADPSLQARVDDWLRSVVRYAIAQSQGEVAGLITNTVARWDGQQTSQLIERQVGRDLQFIRINGTVVGGLAGIAIHAVGQLL